MTKVARATLGRAVVPLTVVAALVLFVGQDACILAAPVGELARLPESRPTILHSSLVPSGPLITQFPSTFLVPVELSDPRSRVAYAVFVDYNPDTGKGLVDTPGHSDPPSALAGLKDRVRVIPISVPAPLEIFRCHKIEIVVALRLESEKDPKLAHTPADPGGDIATWLYNPAGDLKGCPALDVDASAPVDAEAGDGAVR